MIGGVLGAIVGLFEAIGEAQSLLGYVGYVLGGAAMGAIILGLAAAILPWALGIAALGLLLKACGIV
jgi:hypothetical protein